MTNYLVSYSGEGTTASTVVYSVEKEEDIYELAIRDFFNFPTDIFDDENNEVLESAEVLSKFLAGEDFYELCADRGVYFGDIITLEEALRYTTTLSEFK